MKKIAFIIIMILVAIPLAFAFTDDEFYEVYDALQASNEALKLQREEIVELKNAIDILKTENEKLVSELIECSSLLDKAKKDLEKSNTLLEKSQTSIETMLSKKFMIGGKIITDNFSNIKIGMDFGYRLIGNGYCIMMFAVSKNEYTIGISFDMIL